ncbi:MAG: NAD(+)/NADH kinase [Calditrichota bacterium]|jgi:NAD+ kinase
MLKIGVFINPYKSLLQEKLPDILNLMLKNNIKIFCPDSIKAVIGSKPNNCEVLPDQEIPEKCDMVFAFGGDGTVLRMVQIVRHHQTPILAINVGGLGFLTEVLFEVFESSLELILAGKYNVEDRLLLQGEIENDNNPMYVLNEFAIEKGSSTRVIEIRMYIDDKYFNDYVADGLIISTPTGSTGYSLSSGGPIVVPTSECIILNPICPHSLTNRPVIIPSSSKLTAKMYTDHPQIIISADNQDIREVPSRTAMQIKRAPFNARLVKYLDSDYFTLLRNKLGWGEDFRNKLRWSYSR